MASEKTVRVSLLINKVSEDGSTIVQAYQSKPDAYVEDLDNVGGPSPGQILVSVAGTDVDFSELTMPGDCWMMNLDEDNTVHGGIWEPDTSRFYPLFELRPNKPVLIPLSRYLTEQFEGTGTGTGVANNTLRLKADTAACKVRVEAFEHNSG